MNNKAYEWVSVREIISLCCKDLRNDIFLSFLKKTASCIYFFHGKRKGDAMSKFATKIYLHSTEKTIRDIGKRISEVMEGRHGEEKILDFKVS